MNRLVLIAGGSALVYGFLAILMGVLPGIQLSRTPPGPGVVPLTPLEAQGRQVYLANGCSYCHTQQVRPLPMDKVFGRPSAPGDFAYQTPELLGSERTGPDLTNIGARQPSDVWQYIHLYDPRAVVPQSIMPCTGCLPEIAQAADDGGRGGGSSDARQCGCRHTCQCINQYINQYINKHGAQPGCHGLHHCAGHCAGHYTGQRSGSRRSHGLR
ncbi:MAG: hypothetical protein DYH20_12035 [Gammaproteobacteria bacterium PRO9]|nr:hypothetical protein [Gammaproteobacteria bacterium PRO9]